MAPPFSRTRYAQGEKRLRVASARPRSVEVSILGYREYAGKPGTAAEGKRLLIPRAHGLFEVDLRALVSRYIGETEKNLDQMFQAQDGGAAILLFDEADASLGARSEIRDSTDRHAEDVVILNDRDATWRGRLYIDQIGAMEAGLYHLSGRFEPPSKPKAYGCGVAGAFLQKLGICLKFR